MDNLIIILLIGISLSMDAFSVSLSISLSKTKINYAFVPIVGLYHFVMPLLGAYTSNSLINNIFVSSNIIIGIILCLIGINILIGIKDKQEHNIVNIFSYILLGLGVSLDSFGTGIGIKLINSNMIVNSTIFSICSMIFTYIGLKIGNLLNESLGKIANVIGFIILITLGISYII